MSSATRSRNCLALTERDEDTLGVSVSFSAQLFKLAGKVARVLLPPGEGGAKRRMRGARPTIHQFRSSIGRSGLPSPGAVSLCFALSGSR
jgi:hypothetical protein